jgi:hypothetical protein
MYLIGSISVVVADKLASAGMVGDRVPFPRN